MTVLEYVVTPANVHDGQLYVPLLSSLSSKNVFELIKEMYGDNAYDSEKNRCFSREKGIVPLFHTKEETGKTPKKKRSAKKKSKKRSRIEALFGISCENMGLGKTRVRGLPRVAIDISLVFIVWNFGSVYAFFVNQLEDRISLKKLLYNNK